MHPFNAFYFSASARNLAPVFASDFFYARLQLARHSDVAILRLLESVLFFCLFFCILGYYSEARLS